MKATVILADESSRDRRVTVEWAGPATLGQMLAAAAVTVRPNVAVSVDGTVFGPTASLDEVGLRDGTTVSLSLRFHANKRPDDVAREAHVAVVAGIGAGSMIPLGRGAAFVGSDPSCELVLLDRTVAARQAVVHHEPDGRLWLESLAPGTTLAGAPVTSTTALSPGQPIGVGHTVIEVRAPLPADAVVDLVGNVLDVRRPPRIRPPAEKVVVDWPTEPAGATANPLGGLARSGRHGRRPVPRHPHHLDAVVPRPDADHGRDQPDQQPAQRQSLLSTCGHRIPAGLGRGGARTRRRAATGKTTSPRRCAGCCHHRRDHGPGPRRRLWERRRQDNDFLHLRIGLATLPAEVRRGSNATYGEPEWDPLMIGEVPAVVSLTEVGVLGVAGPPEFSGPAACWLVAQAVVTSGPADLQLVVLTAGTPEHQARWEWSRWLAHTLPPLPGGPPLFGTTKESVEARISELVELIGSRHGADTPGQPIRLRSVDWPHVLVVMDPAYDVRRLPGADVILRHGPSVGVHSVCVELADSHLPVECKATLTQGADGTSTLTASDRPVLTGIASDVLTPAWFAAVGRCLAPYRDPEAIVASGTIPTSARLVDLLHLDRLDAPGVLSRWARSHRTTAALVGVGSNGPFSLDLRTDGPHGLVAGTTGAGKSEFLQTLVASLAVVNRHDALNFLLVDYKGGSAFRDCARLPHTVGVVTDLDGHLTARALESLSAELRRREELLARGGAKDLDDYIASGETAGALPRLLIVIDEFASLVAELPDFVTGLIGIAQRGRSLGIHLVLATQRPSGVVSPDIRANTNLRIALRVTSPAESADVIDAPDAARIMPITPGRAYARTGHSALTPFQTARVGGPATPNVTEQGPEVAVAEAGWTEAGQAPRLARVDASGHVDPADTDLARVASVLTDAADQSGIPRPSKPWLPALPRLLLLAELGQSDPAVGGIAAAPFGLLDLPAAQRQQVLAYHPGEARHLAVAGGPGSGRTTLLRTLAVGLAAANRPEDVWLYALDCGGGELRRLSHLPHTGAVVTRTEIDRTSRLLTRLHHEMHLRLERLASEGYTDVGEQRAAADPGQQLPYIVVLVDRWEGFMTTFDPIDNQRLTDLIVDLAREGGGAGIRLVITGDRTLLSGRLAAAIDDRLCLNMPDRNDYAFAGLDIRKLPDLMNPGRAVRNGDGAELQIAVCGADASGSGQTAAITALVRAWRDDPGAGDSARGPYRVDILPTEIDERAAISLGGGGRDGPAGPHSALIGVGGDELTAIRVDIHRSGGFVVAGPRRSGRSNTLAVMARSLLANGCTLVAFCPRPSPLRQFRGQPGVAGVFDGDDPPVDWALDTLNGVEGPLAVLVDDAMVLHGTAVSELLEHVAAEGAEQGHALVVAGGAEELMRPMRGFIYQTVTRAGLLICPEHATDGDLLATHLPRSAVFRHPPGRAILITGPHPTTVQVPLARE